MSTMKIPQVIQVSHRHRSSSQAGRSGARIAMAYAARSTTAATISGQSVARSQRRLRAVRIAISAVMFGILTRAGVVEVGGHDILAEAAGITAGSCYTWPATHVGDELIGAGMLILAGGGRGFPLDYDELELDARRVRAGDEIAARRALSGLDALVTPPRVHDHA
jgi:hypothetical protein